MIGPVPDTLDAFVPRAKPAESINAATTKISAACLRPSPTDDGTDRQTMRQAQNHHDFGRLSKPEQSDRENCAQPNLPGDA